MTDLVSVYDPDGEEHVMLIADAETLGARGQAIFCTPELDFGEDNTPHWHKHDRWEDDVLYAEHAAVLAGRIADYGSHANGCPIECPYRTGATHV